MRSLIGLFLLLAGVSAAFGQTSKTPPNAKPASTLGEVVNGNFVSDRFGLALAIPADFTIVSAAEAQLLADAGADLMKQGPGSDRKLDEAIGRTIRLLVIAEHPIGTMNNAALEMATVKQQTGITARMALLANIDLLKGTPFSLKKALGNVRLGANTFAAAELEASIAGTAVLQRMYVVMHRGYSIVIAITYVTDEQIVAMEKVLGTLVLKKTAPPPPRRGRAGGN